MENISLELESPTLMIVAVVTGVSLITVCLLFYVLKSKKLAEFHRAVLFASLVTASTAMMLLGAFGANHLNEQANINKIGTASAEMGEELNEEQLQQLVEEEILQLSKDKVIVLSDEGVTLDVILYDVQKNLDDQELIEMAQEKAAGGDS